MTKIIGTKSHAFHVVNPSPWPLLASFAAMILAIGGVTTMHHKAIGPCVLIVGLLLVLLSMFVWWRDVIKESVIDKAHSEPVQKGLGMGMMLFILSEIMFFFAFFFAFFYSELLPAGIASDIWEIGDKIWPPAGIEVLSPWEIPFTNTLILLLSGTTVTWAHYAILDGNRRDAVRALSITVALGCIFSLLQAYEYHEATFKFKDGIYAANFYMATGFHGFHVIIGTIFLSICLLRANRGDFDHGKNHIGFEFAAWYWHFVDVVWLFLFVFVYVLGA